MLVYSFIYLSIGHIYTWQIFMELLKDSGHMETYKPWSLPSGGSRTRGGKIKEFSSIIPTRS